MMEQRLASLQTLNVYPGTIFTCTHTHRQTHTYLSLQQQVPNLLRDESMSPSHPEIPNGSWKRSLGSRVHNNKKRVSKGREEGIKDYQTFRGIKQQLLASQHYVTVM